MTVHDDIVPVGAMDHLLSAEEVAAFLRIPVTTLYQWRYKGVGPPGIRVGRHLRYRQHEIEGWLDSLDDVGGHSQSA